MADAPSTLTAWRVGGQLDPAWRTDVTGLVGRTWTAVRATATLVRPAQNTVVVDPTNGAHEHPLVVSETLDFGGDGTPSDGQWRTAPLKAVTAGAAEDALQPSGLHWSIEVGIRANQGNANFTSVYTYIVDVDADRYYSALGETITVDGLECIDINALLDAPLTVPPSNQFETNVLDVMARLGPKERLQQIWTMLTPAEPGDLGVPWIVPAAGTLTILTWYVDENADGNCVLELVNATTAFPANPTVTIGAGQNPPVTTNGLQLAVAAGDVIYPRVGAASTATLIEGITVGAVLDLN